MADWSGLHLDIIVSILKKVRCIEDFVAFGSVCKSWREAARNKQYLRPQIPWAMGPDRENHRQIYSLSKDDILTKNLCIPDMSDKKCFGFNYGWVLTVSREGEKNLVHPLSRSQMKLPQEKSINNWVDNKIRPYPYMYKSCAALSGNPSQTSDFVVMIIVNGAGGLCWSYGRLGKKQWTLIPNQGPVCCDLTYYKGRFYGVEYTGKVWGFSVSDPQDCVLITDLRFFNEPYIVGSEGDLLVVAGELASYKVYKVDLINGGYKRIWSLGDRAIFVGHNTTIAVNVSEFRGGLIKSNHIYFSDGMSSYSLGVGEFTKFNVDWSLRLSEITREPFWFIPSL